MSKIDQTRRQIKIIQQDLIFQIQKFDSPNYYGKQALQGCEKIEFLTNNLVLAVVELTICMEDSSD